MSKQIKSYKYCLLINNLCLNKINLTSQYVNCICYVTCVQYECSKKKKKYRKQQQKMVEATVIEMSALVEYLYTYIATFRQHCFV